DGVQEMKVRCEQPILALLEATLQLLPQLAQGIALPAAVVQQQDVGDRPGFALVLTGEELLHEWQARRGERLQRGGRLVAPGVAIVGEVSDQRLHHRAGLEATELLHGKTLDQWLRTFGEAVQEREVAAIERLVLQ